MQADYKREKERKVEISMERKPSRYATGNQLEILQVASLTIEWIKLTAVTIAKIESAIK